MRFISFNQVAAWYEQTKPIKSVAHTLEDDIRPIGQRKRKWERIKKVDDNTYCLLDGCYGQTMYNHNVTDQYEQDMAAIMWRREADGDYIYIRNGTTDSVPYGRFKFLRRYLPLNMGFRYNQQGKHWVHAKTPTGYEDFPLPKTDYRWDYTLKQAACADDGKRLRFRANEDGTFTRMGDAFKVTISHVNKELKKSWKPQIEAFYVQAAALAPLLKLSWEAGILYRQTINEWGGRTGLTLGYFTYGGVERLPPRLMQQIVEQEDHELRIPAIALVVHAIGGQQEVATKEDLTRIKSAYNRLMNKALGLFETKEV
jgi:hypothetical protein